MIPQPIVEQRPEPKFFVGDLEESQQAIRYLFMIVKKSYERFWRKPVENAVKLNAEASLLGSNAEAVFAAHAQTLTFVFTSAPWAATGIANYPPPVTVTFLEDGSIDVAALEATLESLEEEA